MSESFKEMIERLLVEDKAPEATVHVLGKVWDELLIINSQLAELISLYRTDHGHRPQATLGWRYGQTPPVPLSDSKLVADKANVLHQATLHLPYQLTGLERPNPNNPTELRYSWKCSCGSRGSKWFAVEVVAQDAGVVHLKLKHDIKSRQVDRRAFG